MFKTVSLVTFFLLFSLLGVGNEVSYVQKRSVIIKDGLLYPERLQMFEGESLHLMIGNFMGHSTCLANENKKFFVNVSPGNIVEQQLAFNEIGQLNFTCPGLKGELVIDVRKKPLLMEGAPSRASRNPGSIPDGVWVPRDAENQEIW